MDRQTNKKSDRRTADRSADGKKYLGNVVPTVLAVLSMSSLSQGYAALADSLPTDSVLVTKHVNKAAEYYDKGDYSRAKDEFRAVIGIAPNAVEPYEGLLQCSERTQDWPVVAFAAEKISSLSPQRKQFYEYDYGTALFKMNRYDEAVPHLKSALATADIPLPLFKPIRLSAPEGKNNQSLEPMTTKVVPLQNPQTQGGLTRIQIEDLESEKRVTSQTDLDESQLENFENAINSEFICIARYQGYEPSGDIRFNSPPATHWHIDKILKGPPLNPSLPLRYDFHTQIVKDAPAGWHFDESKLPAKGSKYILFIESAYPKGTKNLFTTYDGSYGRQKASEENLNLLDRLLETHNMKVQGL